MKITAQPAAQAPALDGRQPQIFNNQFRLARVRSLPMPNRQLSVVALPIGTLQTQWTETKENISKSSRLLQEEIFNRFVEDAATGLLFLGFCDKKVTLSPSLEYWRDFAGLFTRQLRRTPELSLSEGVKS